MDLDKTSLIKTILYKLRSYFKSQPCDSVLNELSEIFKKCQFLKLRKLSNDLFFELDSIIDEKDENNANKINDHIESFKLKMLKCTNENHKNHHNSESNNNENNICLSSDDGDYESQKSITSNEDDQKDDLFIESGDSDIEIIDAKEGGGSHYNMRKRKSSNSKENINTIGGERYFKQSRYEFRERRPNFSTPTTNNNNNEDKSSNNNPSQPQRNNSSNAGGTNNKKNNEDVIHIEEVIQIEDSSSDEDVQEIHCEESSSSRSTNFRQPRNKNNSSAGAGFKFHMPTNAAPNDHPPTQADPSQLASIPFVVQFPTMRSSALFNGHLYISHNHKFSVKLQGIDPRNFRWN